MLGPLLPDLPAETKAELGALLPSLLRLLGGAAALPPALQMPLIEGCLGCLAHACALPPHTLQPHKRQVLAALRAPLDHKKSGIWREWLRSGTLTYLSETTEAERRRTMPQEEKPLPPTNSIPMPAYRPPRAASSTSTVSSR